MAIESETFRCFEKRPLSKRAQKNKLMYACITRQQFFVDFVIGSRNGPISFRYLIGETGV
jgi:hypothetical protein